MRVGGRLGPNADTKRVFGSVVLGSPDIRVTVEDQGPVALGRNGGQPIFSFSQLLPVDGHVIGDLQGCRFVGPGTPGLIPGNKITPDGAAAHRRPAVLNGHVGETNALGNGRFRTHPGKLKTLSKKWSDAERRENRSRNSVF